eukprot:TRINITY_DN67789_c0_g1_i1.p1 TRINITY_DN67789_c0_g1~~TRINITY_DN67789_c0_g1_i1.p1  ORF type:complete len:101 (-),score=17.60 TRINITY_DN67789_c0_g1_i1:235-537(-)
MTEDQSRCWKLHFRDNAGYVAQCVAVTPILAGDRLPAGRWLPAGCDVTQLMGQRPECGAIRLAGHECQRLIDFILPGNGGADRSCCRGVRRNDKPQACEQ